MSTNVLAETPVPLERFALFPSDWLGRFLEAFKHRNIGNVAYEHK